MGPLWKGVVLVPPHAKGALGITAVPNRGRSLLPEARQGLISLKAMRRDSPPQELGAKFSWESEWLSPGRGTTPGRGPSRAQGNPAGTLPRLCAHIQGCPCPPAPCVPLGTRLPLEGPSVLKPCVTL